MTTEILFSGLFFLLLGTAYVKGYDFVRHRQPEYLPHFYLLMATIRFLLVTTVVALYVLSAGNREDAIRFALMMMVMYAMMMVVTLKLRH